jgi:VWFA-related protein
MRCTALALIIAAAPASVSAAQAPAPAIAIEQPAPGVVLSGPSQLAASVAPATSGVRQVTFFVDGQQACRVQSEPFACEWDAGNRSTARAIRVVADLVNGQRLVATRRTVAPGLSFGSSVDAVLVPARVLDGNGSFVRGLTVDRFRLFEDDQPQEIVSVLAEDSPASVVLALDMSASMGPKMADLRRAATMFLDSVRAYDAVTLATFNQNLFVLTRPGADDAARREALDRITPWGGTALFDSLVRAADMLRSQPSPRVIVAFTDGEDVDSVGSVQTVRSALQRADVVLYLVVGGNAAPRDSPTGQLARVAEETGGSAWFTPRMESLGDRFTAIVNDLTNGYILLYVPERQLGDGAWRTLRVEIAGPSRAQSVRSRQGYLAVHRR